MGATGPLPGSPQPIGRPAAGRRIGPMLAAAVGIGLLAAPFADGVAGTLTIIPTFDSSITGASNAAAIEGAINTAIGTIEGLYTTFQSVTDNVYFTLGSGTSPATTLNGFFANSYGDYTNALKADAAANPANTVLATALAHLSQGNNAGGASDMVGTSGQLRSLGFSAPPCFDAGGGFNCGDPGHPFDAIVTLDDSKLTFTGTPPAGKFDGLGTVEHQLNEVLGGGGAGSVLDQIAIGPCPGTFFCDKFGALDLYRYSAPGVPSFTTDPNATSFFSVDGGATAILGFNQDPTGNFGDWGPAIANSCPDGSTGGPDALIQAAFPCSNQLAEPYTIGSPEYPMMLSIGYDPKSVPPPLPEPGSLALLATAIAGLAAIRRRR